MEEKYLLVGLKEIKSNKTDKLYYYAYLLLDTPYGFQLIQVLIDEHKYKYFSSYLGKDVTRNFSVKYNTFSKKYEPCLVEI